MKVIVREHPDARRLTDSPVSERGNSSVLQALCAPFLRGNAMHLGCEVYDLTISVEGSA